MVPVDWVKVLSSFGIPVVVVEKTGELRVLLSRLIGGGSLSESVEPFGCQFIV